MKPKIYNIEMKRGADYNLEIQMMDDNNNPFDLSNYEWKAQMREKPESALAYDFAISTVPTQGKVSLFMPYDLTDKIMFSDGVWDIYYTIGEEQRESLLEGKVSVTWRATEF